MTGCSTSSRTSSCSTKASAGATRKVVARNHQVLGVNRAVASVEHQEELKREFPPEKRLQHRVIELPLEKRAIADQKRLAIAESEARARAALLHSRRAGEHRRAGASRSRAARRVLAHAGQRQVLLHGLLRREGAPQGRRAISPSC